jgi:hypothetical protein
MVADIKDINLEEILPFTLGRLDLGPISLRPRQVRRVPRYWYYTQKRSHITSGSIPAYTVPFEPQPLVELSSYPIERSAAVVDISKLDERDMRINNKLEMIYHQGSIPSYAVTVYSLSEIKPLELGESSSPGPVEPALSAKEGGSERRSAPVGLSEGPREFRINENSLPWLDKHFSRMAKIAVEVGSVPPTYTKIRDEYVPVYKDEKGKKIIDHYQHYLYITVQGEPPNSIDYAKEAAAHTWLERPPGMNMFKMPPAGGSAGGPVLEERELLEPLGISRSLGPSRVPITRVPIKDRSPKKPEAAGLSGIIGG